MAAVAVWVSSVAVGSPGPVVTDPPDLGRWAGVVVHVHDADRDPLVGEAVAAWDRLGVIRVAMQDQPCTTGEQCVEVTQGNLPDHIGGITPLRYNGNRVLAARVVLSREYPVGVKVGLDGIPAGWALGIREHELGHALGLPHAPESACAVMSPVSCGTPYPTPYDAWMLQEAYRLP